MPEGCFMNTDGWQAYRTRVQQALLTQRVRSDGGIDWDVLEAALMTVVDDAYGEGAEDGYDRATGGEALP